MVAVAGKIKRKRKILLGPQDNGRLMTLDDFDQASVSDGHLYELNKGVVEVSEIPKIQHFRIVDIVKGLFYAHRAKYPSKIKAIGSGSEAKVLSDPDQSERHPDISVYVTDPPDDQDQPWSEWTPLVAIEVVSESSVKRDYEDKPSEYLTIGIREYWIIDPLRQVIVINTRWRGIWKSRVLKPGQRYEPKSLPGFKLDVRKILNAGK